MSIQPKLLTAYVYTCAPGVDAFCAEQMNSSLLKLGVEPHRVVKLPDSSYLDRALNGDRGTLGLPGGQTMWMGQDLAPLSEKVKAKVRNGWNIWGSCAGGNLLCRQLTYKHRDTALGIMDITKACALWNLMPVKAHTPFFEDQIQIKNPPGKLVPIRSGEEHFFCYWNSGSKFEPLSNGVSVEAHFQPDGQVAALSAEYGQGTLLAIGIHPEIDVESVVDYFKDNPAESALADLRERKQMAKNSSTARDAFLTRQLAQLEILSS